MTNLQHLENLNRLYQFEDSYRGDQPVQKWIKVYKDIELSYEEISNFNKIIVLLLKHIG